MPPTNLVRPDVRVNDRKVSVDIVLVFANQEWARPTITLL